MLFLIILQMQKEIYVLKNSSDSFILYFKR